MIWGKKHRERVDREAQEALAAKIQADLDLSVARELKQEVSNQTRRLRQINSENHFSEGLHRSFQRRTA